MRSLTSSAIVPMSALVLAATPSSAIRWGIKGSSCDSVPFSNLDVDVTCDGSSTCSLGDTATISGTLFATNTFEDADVTLKACVAGMCLPMASRGAGTLCDGWISPADGQECGNKGDYDVYREEEIPSYDDVPQRLIQLLQGAVNIRMMVGNEHECSGRASRNSYSMSSPMAYSALGAAGLALGCWGATAARARRRRRALLNEASAEGGNAVQSRFVEMTDSVAMV